MKVGIGLLEKHKKLLLKANNIRRKLKFAQRHQDWTIHDWYRVIFSDETKIIRYQFDGHAQCWVRDGESQL